MSDKTREAFEDWANSQWPGAKGAQLKRSETSPSHYDNLDYQFMWVGWKAALAQRCLELENALAVKEEFYQDALHSHIALASQRDTLRAEVDRLKAENEDLAAHLADAEHRAENAGRNASAFEDRMGDLQVENGKLRDEIARLHSVLEDDTRVRYYKEYLDRKRGGVEDGDL